MKFWKAGILAIVSVVSLAPLLSAQETPDTATLVQQLQSRETSDDAKEALAKRAATDPEARKYLAYKLPIMIEQGWKNAGRQWINAVRLSGELRIAEAAPALGKWIGLDNMGGEITSGSLRHLETNPAGKALAQIGEPAIPTLADVLDRGTPRERRGAYLALNLIGSPRSLAALKDRLSHEDNVELRQYIEDAMKHN